MRSSRSCAASPMAMTPFWRIVRRSRTSRMPCPAYAPANPFWTNERSLALLRRRVSACPLGKCQFGVWPDARADALPHELAQQFGERAYGARARAAYGPGDIAVQPETTDRHGAQQVRVRFVLHCRGEMHRPADAVPNKQFRRSDRFDLNHRAPSRMCSI
jgi:hypothetical protein